MQKIYTKKGDGGESRIGGKRLSKDTPVLETVGTLDELNSWIGICRGKLRIENGEGRIMAGELKRIQRNLFVINAILAGSRKQIKAGEVRRLEKIIDKLTAELPGLKNFIYPAGEMQVARAVCRRAERLTVRLMNSNPRFRNKTVLKYLNRLSDTLFVMGRWINRHQGTEEEVWK